MSDNEGLHTVSAMLARADLRHGAGDLDGAERLYRAALQHTPDHAEALARYGALLVDRGRPEAAEGFLRQALDQRPDLVSAYRVLALALSRQERPWEAIGLYEQVLRLVPEDPEALVALGLLYQSVNQPGQAEALLRRAVTAAPGHVRGWLTLGVLLMASHALEDAARCFETVLALAPDHAQAHYNLARIQARTGQSQAAEASYRGALDCDPTLAAAWLGLGETLWAQHRPEDARYALWRACALRPVDAGVLTALAQTEMMGGRLDLAETHLRRALTWAPEDALAHWHLGQLLLAQGRLAEGWDARRWGFAAGVRTPDRALAATWWNGDPVDQGGLLIWPEGDAMTEVLFTQTYADAARRVGRVVIEARPLLQSLIARSLPDLTVVTAGDGPQTHGCPYHVPAGELGRWFRRDPTAFGDGAPWLVPDRPLRDHWRAVLAETLPHAGRRVGLAWPITEAAAVPLAALPGVAWVALDPEVPLGWRPEGLEAPDGDALAALIAALDLIIAPPGLVLALAAAMGAPAWGLVPRSWWARLGGEDRWPWGASVRLWVRDHAHLGDETTLAAALAEALAPDGNAP